MTNYYNRILLASIVCLVNIALCVYILITPDSALPRNWEILTITTWTISIIGYKYCSESFSSKRK